jgi:hypothetical protein
MTDVAIVAGETLLVKVDITGTDTFVHPCLINTTRGISLKSNTTDTEVADCADQSLPAKIVRKVKSIDFTVTGAGKVDATSVLAYMQWWQSAAPKNVEIVQDLAGAAGGWMITVPMILSQFDVKGARGEYQDVDITLVPAGTYTLAATA